MSEESDHTMNASKKKWIETGYETFAIEGYSGLNVEKLAKAIERNKSAFYYFFKDRETYLQCLLDHHMDLAKYLLEDMAKVKNVDPDFILMMVKFKTTLLVHRQLIRHREHQILIDAYDLINKKVDPFVSPIWADFIGLDDEALAFRYYEQFRDMLYIRLTPETMTFEFLREMLNEAKGIVQEMIKQSGE